jgi:hypothetical protein
MYILVAWLSFGPEIMCEKVGILLLLNYFYMHLSCFGR